MCGSELHPKMFTEASIQVRLKEWYLWPKKFLRNDLRVTIFHGVKHAPDPYLMRVMHTLSTLAVLMLCQRKLLSLATPLRKLSEKCQKWNSSELCAATGQSWTSFKCIVHMFTRNLQSHMLIMELWPKLTFLFLPRHQQTWYGHRLSYAWV